jgi:hypothetical protein
MRRFTDSTGRQWTVRIDDAARDRVRALLGVDPVTVGGWFWTGLVGDPARIAALIWAVCRPQAEARGMGTTEFGRMLEADVDAATEAVIQATIDAKPRDVRRRLRHEYNGSQRAG